MNKENLKNYKTYVGLGLAATLLIAAFAMDIKSGFFGNLIAAFSYLACGGVLGIVTYYIFLETRSY